MYRRPPLAPGDPRHGTRRGYANWNCRCDPCREAASRAELAKRAARKPLPPGDLRHGTDNGYSNWRCRCDLCVLVGCLLARRRYAARRAASRLRTS